MKLAAFFRLGLTAFGLCCGVQILTAQQPAKESYFVNFLNQQLVCQDKSCASPGSSGRAASHLSDRRIHWDTSYPALKTRDPRAQAEFLERAYRAELTPQELQEPDISVTRYTCPQKDTLLVERRYGKEAYILIQLKKKTLFKWEDYSGKNQTLYNHPNWTAYMCGFSAEDFFNRRTTPPLPKSMRPSVPDATTINPAAKTSGRTVQFMADVYYPAKKTKNSGSVSRLYISKKNQEVRYLQFTFFTGYTAAQAERDLKKKYNSVHTHWITCDASRKVMETASDGVYHLILLTPRAMVTLQKKYHSREAPSAQLHLSNRQYMCRYAIADGLYPAGN